MWEVCFRLVYAPVKIMPHYPLHGYIGEKVGHLTCLTLNFPEFDHSPYACTIFKSTDSQIPHLLLNF